MVIIAKDITSCSSFRDCIICNDTYTDDEWDNSLGILVRHNIKSILISYAHLTYEAE